MPNRGPYLPNLEPIIAAGIDPKTGLPKKLSPTSAIKSDVKLFLRLIDEQDAVNRYVWYNLPCGLSSQEVEKMLYYHGQLAFFYYEPLDQFYFMKYCLDGTLDFYGRYNRVHPLPIFATGAETGKEKTEQQRLLEDYKLNVQHSVLLEEPDENTLKKSCVLLYDYSKQRAETIIPRAQVNDCILDVMADCVPFMNTSLLLGTGVKGMRVNDADQQANVYEATRSFKDAALKGLPYIPIIGSIEFQDLTDGQLAKAEEFMLAMQSLDNLRLSGYGIDNGGLFEKKAREVTAEVAINGGPVGLVLQDGLSIRQNFCNIVNSIWDLGIWCEPAESITQMDVNGDGAMYDRNDNGQNSGVDAPSEEGGSEQ